MTEKLIGTLHLNATLQNALKQTGHTPENLAALRQTQLKKETNLRADITD